MQTVKLGTRKRDIVTALQELLNLYGNSLAVDGIFGPVTESALRRYQKENSLVSDGIAGPKTWTVLFSQFPDYNAGKSRRFLTEKDLVDAARDLDVETAAVKAVNEVESRGSGFIAGRPVILFEGHIFWRRLEFHGVDPAAHVAGNEDILYRKWISKHYIGGIGEHGRLERAKLIHRDAAQESASWGLFQIMGFHHSVLGYKSIGDFVKRMEKNEREHLLAFVRFIKTNGLDVHLRNRDWAKFARAYNGPGYRKNRYDEKLEKAYKRYI